mmetsp:Transcript_35119/g.52201  ORF Transcript_35119/g.52201 Transcript_35119/m.52201 type:complete len:93 (+) Transcript_35119:3-281(+)
MRTEFEDRIGENAVLTQKLKDEKRTPWHEYKWWQNCTRRSGFDHFCIAHSSLKNSPGGYRSSTKSMEYYLDKSAQYKATLLAEASSSTTVEE